MILIDGSEGEGGGQMLRSSLALSMLTGKPFKLVNIRAKRSKPGLAAQHLACVLAAAKLCRARYKGAELRSTTLVFEPGEVTSGDYEFHVGTAGAVGLVLQTVALPAALRGRAASSFTITGGTHVARAPSFTFLETTWTAFMRAFGMNVNMTMTKPGFYPRGGGEINAVVQPCSGLIGQQFAQPLPFTTVSARSIVASLPAAVNDRQAAKLSEELRTLGLEVILSKESWEQGPSTVVAIVTRQGPVPLAFVELGERGKPAEHVARDAVSLLQTWSQSRAPVDPYSGDQILLVAACSQGTTHYFTSEITQHLLTHRDVIASFLPVKIDIDGELGQPGYVTVKTEL